MSPEPASVDDPGTVLGFDHIALPLLHAEAMVAFYRMLGLEVSENPSAVQVYLGEQMINFHRPELWQGNLSLRASAATPPCGDFCLVWEGSVAALQALLARTGAEVVEGPVERTGGRRASAVSHYVRDPDGNLVEFMIYP
jgi:catechol 2,3-dioxygenase-like lactoylglutathione lyase family enzyme